LNLKNHRGGIKPFICIILLGISVYIGYMFGMPYYHYYSLKSETKAIARLSFRKPDRYVDMVYETARSLRVPIERMDIHVSTKNNNVRISTSWSEVVDFFGYYSVPLHFQINVEE
jgi:hypothetical protein